MGDIVLIGESRESINSKFELWRQTLKTKIFRLSKSKIEYMYFDFSKTQEVSKFKYLESIIQDDEEINDDVTHKI